MSQQTQIPPQDLNAEMSVLGALLIEKSAFFRAAEILEAGDFCKKAHEIIFKAVTAVAADSEPVDVITISSQLEKTGDLETCGGSYYLTQLVNHTPSAASVEYYAQIVKDKSMLRRVLLVSERAKQTAGGHVSSPVELISGIVSELQGIGIDRVIPAESAAEVFEQLTGQIDSGKGGNVQLIPSGFKSLDKSIGYFVPSDYVLLAARPSMGKTAFALQWALQAAEKFPVYFISAEMNNLKLMTRLASNVARVNSRKLRTMEFSSGEAERIIKKGAERFADLPLFMSYGNITYSVLEQLVFKGVNQFGAKVFFLDYIQKIRDAPGENKRVQSSNVSAEIKRLSEKYNILFVALSQLSRSPYQRTDHRPILSDLKETGSLEEDADLVFFLHRPDYYEQRYAGQSMSSETELINAKHRNGDRGKTTYFDYYLETGFFSEATCEQNEQVNPGF